MRVAAKEITSLILDDERLRAERSDRKSWKSRVTGLEEFAPQQSEHSPRRPRERRPQRNDEDDAEYKLALEASMFQEEEDRKKREGRGNGEDDDDLAKAIQLSQEEEAMRRRELEETNANLLFDDTPSQPANQVQNTGYNQGYQQGNQVDFFANPVEQNTMMNQPTGFINQGYTGFPSQPTGMPNYGAFNMPTGMGMGQYGQQQNMPNIGQQGQNPYAQVMQQPQQPPQTEPAPQPGSNNPWATNQSQQQAVAPTPTGSNNPFAQQLRPQAGIGPGLSPLSSLPEQKTLATFNNTSSLPPQPQSQPSYGLPQQSASPAQQPPVNEYQSKLNSLLASGDGMDTFGNTGDMRIPAQHTAPGVFANSAGSGVQRLNSDATGNPYMRQQFTGMPNVLYGGQTNGQGSNNPFGARPPQQQGGPNQDLIQF